MSQIVANNISKAYNKRPILRGVSVKINQGEIVGLLGPNGAGKTTCFYCITGLIKPDHGQILIDNTNISRYPFYRRARAGIGYLPQESSIFRSLTVAENIMAVLETIYDNPDTRQNKLNELMNEFSISYLKDAPSIALSGGERRRLEIARALASNPKFILLDEPFAGVDPISVGDIKNLITHLKDKGLGVLITDHNVRETLSITDRAYILHDGKILAEGDSESIILDTNVRRVYLGENFSI
ncbi:MAG: LPS export ABC transporter ATP-binding protein [Alphaproteobacteria bacterium]|nr:LPS export ABC transporter ATP-binding protein [Alphaproteobacteria bacterium]